MRHEQAKTRAGYYDVLISNPFDKNYLKSNTERAFIIAQLQDLLSARTLLEEPHAHQRLASHIDLLAFSILPGTMRFVLFSISASSVTAFTHLLLKRLALQDEWRTSHPRIKADPIIYTRQLAGPHEALATSADLHLNHLDWEFDRYSSIGFYLHDRRGDWMRLWRLTHLYENNTAHYRELLATRH